MRSRPGSSRTGVISFMHRFEGLCKNPHIHQAIPLLLRPLMQQAPPTDPRVVEGAVEAAEMSHRC